MPHLWVIFNSYRARAPKSFSLQTLKPKALKPAWGHLVWLLQRPVGPSLRSNNACPSWTAVMLSFRPADRQCPLSWTLWLAWPTLSGQCRYCSVLAFCSLGGRWSWQRQSPVRCQLSHAFCSEHQACAWIAGLSVARAEPENNWRDIATAHFWFHCW